jgi:hypothetical protein
MKKILVLLVTLVLLTGCVAIQDVSVDTIINETMGTKYTNLYNHVGKGYKYYLPKTLISKTTDNNNEIIKSKKCDYYLYVDLISYHNKVDFEYKESTGVYFSKLIEKDDKKGVINIYENADDKFLVKIEFNYAYIEVITDKDNLNKTLANALIIVTSMQYNDDVIETLLEEGILTSIDETVDIFDSKDKQNVLEVDDTYIEEDEATKYDNSWIK